MQIIKTGTYDMPVGAADDDAPSVMRNRRERTVKAWEESGVDSLDIPAFLRKQAD
jgi:cell division protein FtsZ